MAKRYIELIVTDSLIIAIGYGEGIAKLFAHEGAIVIVADINEKGGQR